MDKVVIGLVEKVKIKGVKEVEVLVKIDTGSRTNSIDTNLASEAQLGPIIKSVSIKSSHGKQIRPVVKAKIEIGGKILIASFNIASRGHLDYPVLIGTRTLKRGFLIDPSKK